MRDPDEALEKALARLQLSVQKKLGSGAEKSKKSKKGKRREAMPACSAPLQSIVSAIKKGFKH